VEGVLFFVVVVCAVALKMLPHNIRTAAILMISPLIRILFSPQIPILDKLR
jgi:hypothetical protein